jgi:hypothetical protein
MSGEAQATAAVVIACHGAVTSADRKNATLK